MKTIQVIKNQNGMILPIVLASSVLIAVVGLSTSLVHQNMIIKYQYEAGVQEREKLFDEVRNTLSSPSVCNTVFNTGNVGSGNVIQSANVGVLQTINSKPEFKNFILDNIKSNFVANIDYRQNVTRQRYRIEFDIRSKNLNGVQLQFAKTFGGLDKYNQVKKNEEVYLTLGSNGYCTVQTNFQNTTTMGATNNEICKSLGGNVGEGKCYIREYPVQNGAIAFKTEADQLTRNRSTFNEALCDYELKALQKGGYHLMMATGQYEYGWTTLCQRPRWSGCRARNAADGQMYIQGQKWQDLVYEGKAKYISNRAKAIVEDTVKRRLIRVANEQGMSSGAYNSNFQMGTYSGPDGSQKDAIGLVTKGIAGSLASTSSSYFSAVALGVGGPVGAIAGAILSKVVTKILFKGCDRGRIRVDYRCNEGYSEASRLNFQVQKVSFKGGKKRCKWKNKGSLTTPTEIQLAKYLINDQPIPSDYAEEADPEAEDEVASMMSFIAGANSLDDLYAENSNEEDDYTLPSEEGEGDEDVPKVVSDSYLNKEISLWSALKSSVESLKSLASNPPTQGADELLADYNKKVLAFYQGLETQLQAKSDEIAQYTVQAAQANFRDPNKIKTYINSTKQSVESAVSDLKDRIVTAGGSSNLNTVALDEAYDNFDENVAASKTNNQNPPQDIELADGSVAAGAY